MADLIDGVVASARDAGLAVNKGDALDALALLGTRDPELVALWEAVQSATRLWAREKPTAARGTAWDDLRRAAREAARAEQPATEAAARTAAEQLGLKGRAPVRLWLAAHRAEDLERKLRAKSAKIPEAARELADDAVERAYQLGREWADAERDRRLAHYREWLAALGPLDLIDFVVLLGRSPEQARRRIGVVQPERGSWLLDEALRDEHARRGVGVPGSPESRQALLAQATQKSAIVLSSEKRAAQADAEALRARIADLRARVRPAAMRGGAGLAFDPSRRLANAAEDLPTEAMAYGARTADDLRDLVALVAAEVDEIERDHVSPELPAPAKEPAEADLLDVPRLVPGEAWRYEEGSDGWDTPWRPVTLRADEAEGAAYVGMTSVSGGGVGPKGTFQLFEWRNGQRAAQAPAPTKGKRQQPTAPAKGKRQRKKSERPARPGPAMIAALEMLAEIDGPTRPGPFDWTGPNINDRLRDRAVAAGFARVEEKDNHWGPRYWITPAGRDVVRSRWAENEREKPKPAKQPGPARRTGAVAGGEKAAPARPQPMTDGSATRTVHNLNVRIAGLEGRLGSLRQAAMDPAHVRAIDDAREALTRLRGAVTVADQAAQLREAAARLNAIESDVHRLGKSLAPPDGWDLVLLACGKAKGRAAAPLIDLYTGPVYTAHRKIAEHLVGREGIDAILSARHGWASPETRAEPYDERLGSAAKRRAWSERILDHLRAWQARRPAGAPKPRILVLGGAEYIDGWAPAARELGIEVDDPLAGYTAGERRELAGRLPEVLPPRPGRAAFSSFINREMVDRAGRPRGGPPRLPLFSKKKQPATAVAPAKQQATATATASEPATAEKPAKPAKKTAKKTAKKKTAKKTAKKKINARELARGTAIELAEHPTIDKKRARQLARDHLRLDPAAYRGKRAPKPAAPKPAKVERPRCAGSISRLVQRYEAMVARRAGRLTTRQAARREALLARQQTRERTLAGRDNGSPRARATAQARLKAAEKRHAQQRRELDRRNAAELDALKRRAECHVLNRAQAAKAVRLGCGELCHLTVPGGIGGDQAMVALPSARSAPRTLPARYVLVSAASLIASHDATTFDARPDYPSKVQERRYERDNLEKGKVISIAQSMLPALIENTNPGAIDGTPIITPTGIVLSGNGRAMGTQRHYLSGRRVLAEWLERHAGQFGIDPRAVRTIRDPIIVRVVDVPPGEWGRLVRDFNVSLTQRMSAEVEAAALARQLPPDVPRLLRDGNADAGLAEYLTSRASLPLVGALERSGYITAATRSRLLGADGLLSVDGRADFERMLIAAVLPVEVVERSPELARALDRSAVSWLAAAGAGPDWDVRADLAAAAEDYLAMRSANACLAQWQEQASLVTPATQGRPMARTLLEILVVAASRPVVFGRIASAFAASSREASLFVTVDPLEALKQAAASGGVEPARAMSRQRCRKAA